MSHTSILFLLNLARKKKGIILSPNLDNSSKIQQGSLIVVIVVNMTASYI